MQKNLPRPIKVYIKAMYLNKKKFLSAVADIAKRDFADKIKNIRYQPLVFGLVSNSTIHTGLICVKIPATNFSRLGHFKTTVKFLKVKHEKILKFNKAGSGSPFRLYED